MRRILCKTFDRGDDRRIGTPDRRNDFIRRPAAAERLIERHKTVPGKPDDFRALLLQRELLPFGVEHVEEVGQAAVVTLRRHLGRLTGRVKREIEAAQALTEALIGRIGFVDLLDRDENRLLVNAGQFVGAVVGDLDPRIEGAEVEDRSLIEGPIDAIQVIGIAEPDRGPACAPAPEMTATLGNKLRGAGANIGD